MLRATSIATDRSVEPFDFAVLEHDQRHLRRKVIALKGGERILVDLAEPVHLGHGDRLVLEDGRHAEIIAAEEDLLEVRAGNGQALTALAWHIGNRHLPAQIEATRILILRDHVIEEMLKGLGADVKPVREGFQPERGAYSGGGHHHHGHAHDHGHGHGNHHDHGHGHHHDRDHDHGHGYNR